ncbi:MAG: diphthine--ammonia ligase [Candidatus Omnitrophica bacterium]|nr:diphthine--ammonia ligase [Candidatus Omnitrophota bacterium]MBU4478522.1 diphthine--ammonia ligase [Candidatus Omnitrophota bacterium]
MGEDMKAFVSWSSGKESCLSLFRTQKKLQVEYLFNMAAEDGRHSRSHGIGSDLIQSQADALGLALIQRNSSWPDYEETFKKTLVGLKEEGVTAGVFGDIDVQAHRDWVEGVCGFAGIKAVLPLWQEQREPLVREFIDAGFRAVVVCVNSRYLGREWLGREIDDKFIADIKKTGTSDIAGERGEYHTFVFDGPLFKKPLKFSAGEKRQDNEYCFLELVGRSNNDLTNGDGI